LDCRRGEKEETQANESLDWVRISELAKKPKWVFDGRGLVDVKGMEKLGFRVEVIGRVGSRSPLEGETAIFRSTDLD
jgi:UDPglucose 6-dehydrogenase